MGINIGNDSSDYKLMKGPFESFHLDTSVVTLSIKLSKHYEYDDNDIV